MPSNINHNIPVAGANLLAEPIRNNFTAAKSEIEALQSALENVSTTFSSLTDVDPSQEPDGQVLTTASGVATWADPPASGVPAFTAFV